jgi:hypothetical protein
MKNMRRRVQAGELRQMVAGADWEYLAGSLGPWGGKMIVVIVVRIRSISFANA